MKKLFFSLGFTLFSFLLLIVFPGETLAITFRRPLQILQSPPVNYHYDNNGTAAGAINAFCSSSRVYNGHTGTDFSATLGTPILAAARGELYQRYDSCATIGYLGSPCGNGYGNHVRIDHEGAVDGYGWVTIYAHMKQGTPAWYQSLLCSTYVGQVGSSGSSTNPHLHFEVRKNGTPRDDPYSGSCNARGASSASYWTNQYLSPSPSPQCGI